MKRLIEKTVFLGLVTAWRLAGVPTSRWPSLLNATTEGVVRPPSAFGITVGSPPSMTAMHELVVPRSMPSTLLISSWFLLCALSSLRKPQSLCSRFCATVPPARGTQIGLVARTGPDRLPARAGSAGEGRAADGAAVVGLAR